MEKYTPIKQIHANPDLDVVSYFLLDFLPGKIQYYNRPDTYGIGYDIDGLRLGFYRNICADI